MPGIGSTCSPWANVHASATCAGVAPTRRATPRTRATMAWFASTASAVKRGLFDRKSDSSKLAAEIAPVEEPAPQRGERHEPGAVPGAPGHDVRERIARPQAHLRLDRRDRMDRVRPFGLRDREGRKPEGTHLAGADEFGHRAPGLLDGDVRIDAVEVVEVHHIGAQPSEGSVDRRPHVLRARVAVERVATVRSHEQAHLGGHLHAVAAV